MNTKRDPKEIAEAMITRSSCHVRVGAVLVDKAGNVFSWGWNSMGLDGFGQCAEIHCIKRANRARLPGSVMLIAGERARNKKAVPAKPCTRCQRWLDRWKIKAIYRDSNLEWRKC